MTARRMIIMLVLVAVVFGGIFGMQYLGRKGMAKHFDNMPTPPAVISTAIAEQQTWQTVLEAPGSIVSVLSANVSSEAGGIVKHVRVHSGETVSKGDLIIELDRATDAAELAQLEAQAELGRINHERRQKLFKLEAVSKSDVDVAQSEYDASQAAVKAQRAKLAQKEIRAPFSGDVGILNVSIGAYLAPGEPAVSLRSMDPLYVDFELPERYVGQVASGQKFSIRTEAYGAREFDGVVEAVEPQIDAATRNIRLRGHVPNADRALRPGQFAQVRLSLPLHRKVVVIPRTAIDYSAYGTALFVVTPAEGTNSGGNEDASEQNQTPLIANKRFVTLGEARGDLIVVDKGLDAGEVIVSSGLLKIRTGKPVKINNDLIPNANARPTPSQG